ncbi:MAG TPA: carboxypeptidase-like regulatory domain-containing protein [Thermoanaerobaculia bacterium]|nr:carboxypeptidase-like regulatory domain-containing protein [Thermoanaerobaculia bacterium]
MIRWSLLLPLLVASAPAAVPPPEPAWIEAVPLTRFLDPPRHFVLESPDERVALAGGDELWLVCSGGGGHAVGCRRGFLPGDTELAVDRGEGVAVRVRLASGREPIAGARVSVTPAGVDARRNVVMPLALRDGELVRVTASAENGTAELPPLAAGPYWIEVQAPWGRSYRRAMEVPAPERLRAAAEPVLDLGEWEIDRGNTLEILAVDDRGAPVPAAVVRVHQPSPREGQEGIGATAKADDEGYAQLGGLTAQGPVEVECFGPVHLPGRVELEAPPPFVECPLIRAATVAGRVVDGEGEPVAGAVLVARAAEPRPARDPGLRPPPHPRAATDHEGRVELPELPPGAHRLTLAAPGFTVRDLAVELAPGETRDLGELALAPGVEVAGEVVDAGGAGPVAGVRLVALDPPGAVDATTGADGAFGFAADPERPLELELTADGYAATRVGLEPEDLASGEPLRLTLGRAGYIRAVVWNEELDAPCGGCSLSVQGPSDAGLFLADSRGEALSPPLASGHYDVYLEEVSTEGSTITVHSGRTIRRATVRPGETVTVRFGEPRPRLEVRLSRALPPGWSLTAKGPRGQRRYGTGAGGETAFDVLRGEGEALSLRLAGPGVTVPLARVPFDFRGDRLDLELPDTWVGGRLAAGAEAGELRLVPLAGAGGGAGTAGGVWTRLDADGAFEVRYLPPGTWAAMVEERIVARFAVAAGHPLDLGLLEPPPDG